MKIEWRILFFFLLSLVLSHLSSEDIGISSFVNLSVYWCVDYSVATAPTAITGFVHLKEQKKRQWHVSFITILLHCILWLSPQFIRTCTWSHFILFISHVLAFCVCVFVRLFSLEFIACMRYAWNNMKYFLMREKEDIIIFQPLCTCSFYLILKRTNKKSRKSRPVHCTLFARMHEINRLMKHK